MICAISESFLLLFCSGFDPLSDILKLLHVDSVGKVVYDELDILVLGEVLSLIGEVGKGEGNHLVLSAVVD